MPGARRAPTAMWTCASSRTAQPNNSKPPGPSAGPCARSDPNQLSRWFRSPPGGCRKSGRTAISSSPPCSERAFFLPRKTDANNPADWVWMATADLEMLRSAAAQQAGFTACRSKLGEVLEKTMKAELIRLGWTLERLLDELIARRPRARAFRG